MNLLLLGLIFLIGFTIYQADTLKSFSKSVNDSEKDNKYWEDQAQMTLKEHLAAKPNTNVAKNIIIFMGDGMSITTITAARILSGQLKGKSGEQEQFAFQNFPSMGLAKTYCVDFQTADSACTATAFLGGVKGNADTIGVNGHVPFGNCTASNDPKNHVHSIAYWAQKAGKRTGVVTNTKITDASPAGAFAHTAYRIWQSDNDVANDNQDPGKCPDIAKQLIENEPGKSLNVIMGGGRTKFIPNTSKDEYGNQGERLGSKHLINEWKADKAAQNSNASYVTNRDDLLKVNPVNTEYLLGLFAPKHMSYHSDADHSIEPTLTEMTDAAIKVLQQGPNGYFLFVEGGRIDDAHHETLAAKALYDTVEFANAIERAVNITDSRDTLIVVTSDHSHTMSVTGYQNRGADILGTMDSLWPGELDGDKLPIATLSYANGPGFVNHIGPDGKRIDLRTRKMDKDFQYPAAVDYSWEAHSGEDVGVFASGPYAHLLNGVYEQTFIPTVMKYAARIEKIDK